MADVIPPGPGEPFPAEAARRTGAFYDSERIAARLTRAELADQLERQVWADVPWHLTAPGAEAYLIEAIRRLRR